MSIVSVDISNVLFYMSNVLVDMSNMWVDMLNVWVDISNVSIDCQTTWVIFWMCGLMCHSKFS